jgi:hypothetical protein
MMGSCSRLSEVGHDLGYEAARTPKFVGMKEYLLNLPLAMRIRKGVGRYFLEKQMEGMKRESAGIPLREAKRIGILFSGEDEATLKSVTIFVEELRKSGKSVRCMGYVPREKVAETLRTAWSLEFFTQADLNWYFRPESRHALSFIEEPFDLLIDLRLQRRMPLPFMVSLSKAKFKVGCHHEDEKVVHDLMIRSDESISLPEFIGQLRHYLEMVGPRSDSKK